MYISSFFFFFFSHGGKGIAENCQSLIVFCVGRRFGKGIKESSTRNDMEGWGFMFRRWISKMEGDRKLVGKMLRRFAFVVLMFQKV